MIKLQSAFVLICLVVGATCVENTVHWQWRDLECTTKNATGNDKISTEPAECRVILRDAEKDTNGRPAPEKSVGCFDEVVNGTTRAYCDLLCPNADTVYLIKRDPQVHRSCFVFYTHRLERRGDDWFLWRDKNCRLSQIKFTIRCEFLFPRKAFPSDEEVFRKLRKRI
uniref:Secreted protein n=1 Tax=Panagrellus redivivus TaxID=6233 RepID=A0A7E4UZB8_PANRE